VARAAPAGADHETLRLSAFRFLIFLSFVLPFFVIAGLDPAIHAGAKLDRTYRLDFASRSSAWTTGSSPVVTR
jgi:hypothetical protein